MPTTKACFQAAGFQNSGCCWTTWWIRCCFDCLFFRELFYKLYFLLLSFCFCSFRRLFVACQCRMDRVVSCQALICCEAKWKLCRFETKLGRLYLGVENCAYGWADSPKQKKLNQNFRSLDKRTRFRSLDFYDKIAFFSPYSVFFDQLTFDTARFLSNDHLP